MRRLLFAAGAALGSADGELTRDERQVLEEMLGALPQRVDPEVLASLIPERIKAVRDAVRPSRRAQLIRDLALVARADGVVHPKEIELMEGLAADLDVEVRLVRAALEGPIEVD
jgi:tellurite resistance protein